MAKVVKVTRRDGRVEYAPGYSAKNDPTLKSSKPELMARDKATGRTYRASDVPQSIKQAEKIADSNLNKDTVLPDSKESNVKLQTGETKTLVTYKDPTTGKEKTVVKGSIGYDRLQQKYSKLGTSGRIVSADGKVLYDSRTGEINKEFVEIKDGKLVTKTGQVLAENVKGYVSDPSGRIKDVTVKQDKQYISYEPLTGKVKTVQDDKYIYDLVSGTAKSKEPVSIEKQPIILASAPQSQIDKQLKQSSDLQRRIQQANAMGFGQVVEVDESGNVRFNPRATPEVIAVIKKLGIKGNEKIVKKEDLYYTYSEEDLAKDIGITKKDKDVLLTYGGKSYDVLTSKEKRLVDYTVQSNLESLGYSAGGKSGVELLLEKTPKGKLEYKSNINEVVFGKPGQALKESIKQKAEFVGPIKPEAEKIKAQDKTLKVAREYLQELDIKEGVIKDVVMFGAEQVKGFEETFIGLGKSAEKPFKEAGEELTRFGYEQFDKKDYLRGGIGIITGGTYQALGIGASFLEAPGTIVGGIYRGAGGLQTQTLRLAKGKPTDFITPASEFIEPGFYVLPFVGKFTGKVGAKLLTQAPILKPLTSDVAKKIGIGSIGLGFAGYSAIEEVSQTGRLESAPVGVLKMGGYALKYGAPYGLSKLTPKKPNVEYITSKTQLRPSGKGELVFLQKEGKIVISQIPFIEQPGIKVISKGRILTGTVEQVSGKQHFITKQPKQIIFKDEALIKVFQPDTPLKSKIPIARPQFPKDTGLLIDSSLKGKLNIPTIKNEAFFEITAKDSKIIGTSGFIKGQPKTALTRYSTISKGKVQEGVGISKIYAKQDKTLFEAGVSQEAKQSYRIAGTTELLKPRTVIQFEFPKDTGRLITTDINKVKPLKPIIRKWSSIEKSKPIETISSSSEIAKTITKTKSKVKPVSIAVQIPKTKTTTKTLIIPKFKSLQLDEFEEEFVSVNRPIQVQIPKAKQDMKLSLINLRINIPSEKQLTSLSYKPITIDFPKDVSSTKSITRTVSPQIIEPIQVQIPKQISPTKPITTIKPVVRPPIRTVIREPIPPVIIPPMAFDSNLTKDKKKKRKKKSVKIKMRRGYRELLPDLFSVDRSKLKYGKATPLKTSKAIKYERSSFAGAIPTVELAKDYKLSKRNKKQRGFKWF